MGSTMQTRLFEWAQDSDISMRELARLTGYSWRQLYRARSNPDRYVTSVFRDRVVGAMGDWARALFFDPNVSQKETECTQVIHPQDQEDTP